MIINWDLVDMKNGSYPENSRNTEGTNNTHTHTNIQTLYIFTLIGRGLVGCVENLLNMYEINNVRNIKTYIRH